MMESDRPEMRQADENINETPEKQIEAARPALLRFIQNKMSGLTGKSHLTPEDVAQQTMLNAIKKVNNLRADSNIIGWLHTIANNIIISELRHQKTTNESEDYIIETVRSTHDQSTPIPSDPLLRERMQKAILKLKPDYSATLRLLLEGNTYKEIANQLGITEPGAKSRVRRAKNELNKLLGNEGVDLGDELLSS